MTVSLTHTFQSAKPDGSDTALVQPSNWNAEHTLTAAAGTVIGRNTSGAGAVQELPIAVTATGDVSFSGSLGVGTSTPGQKLTVAGVIETTSGGVKFPDGTTQTSAGGAVAYPQNIQSGNYTLILSDAGKHIYSANAGAQTITIPTNASVAFPIGTIVTIVNFGTTLINLSVSGVSVYPNGSTVVSPYPVIAVGAAVQILKTGTNTWASTFGILPSAKNSQIAYLSVAGGGGGGSGLVSGDYYDAGGGGAGGAVFGKLGFAVGTLTVTIGAGGAGNTGNGAGSQGGSTLFTGTTTAVGGGAGGGNGNANGGTGGSGGGAGSDFSAIPGVGTVNQGTSGSVGGAGGAGSSGKDNIVISSVPFGGYGGDGVASAITGASVIYGGGGAGGDARSVPYASRGGAGGGGDGARAGDSIGATAGTANRGGGGGGGAGNAFAGGRFNGGNGGSGVVIVSTPIVATSTTGSPTITTVGGDTIYQFNSSGSITW